MILLTNLYERFHVRERHVTKAVQKWFDSEHEVLWRFAVGQA